MVSPISFLGSNRPRTGDLDLLENDLIDRQRDFTLFALSCQTDLDVAPALAQTGNSVATGGSDAQGVHAHVGAAMCQVHNCLDGVGLLAIDDVGGAGLPG